MKTKEYRKLRDYEEQDNEKLMQDIKENVGVYTFDDNDWLVLKEKNNNCS